MMESVWQWLLCDRFKLGSKQTGLHMLVKGLTKKIFDLQPLEVTYNPIHRLMKSVRSPNLASMEGSTRQILVCVLMKLCPNF